MIPGEDNLEKTGLTFLRNSPNPINVDTLRRLAANQNPDWMKKRLMVAANHFKGKCLPL